MWPGLTPIWTEVGGSWPGLTPVWTEVKWITFINNECITLYHIIYESK